MKKIIIILSTFILIAGVFLWKVSNNPSSVPPEHDNKITIINPLGPAVVPVMGIHSNNVESKTPLQVEFWKNTDEAIALLAGDDVNFAILPVSLAANIYANNIEIALLGVHEWKVFYLLAAEDSSFESWKSLKDHNVYLPHGRGQTVDILLRSALMEAGLNPDQDLDLLYAPPQEIVKMVKTGKADFAALPEPFVSLCMQNSKNRIVMDFQKYWEKSTNMSPRIPVAGLFVKKDFLQEHPDKCRDIAETLANSTSWGNDNTDTVIELTNEILPIPAPVMKKALTRIDFNYVPVQDCQTEVEFFLKKMNELYPDGLPILPNNEFYAR